MVICILRWQKVQLVSWHHGTTNMDTLSISGGSDFMKNLKTIDGETLMSQPLQPLNFVVDTLISQGLHILAGSPKVG